MTARLMRIQAPGPSLFFSLNCNAKRTTMGYGGANIIPEEVMGEKTVLMDVEETLLRYDAAVMLRKLADELAQGRLACESGQVEVGPQVKLEAKGKVKSKEEGSKASLKIELCWRIPG